MKTTLRIPTKEPYAYVEVELDGEELSPNGVKKLYDDLTSEMNSDTSSGKQTESKFLDFIISVIDSDFTKWGHVDDYAAMNDQQKAVVQSMKRFYKRLPKEE